MDKPTNDIEALTLALRLAVSAPTDEQSQKALKLANQLSSSLTKEQVDAVKAELEVEMADE
tara:strand:+ start:252 stop:434 length:183 start_codon:yes stop_codon:yes gene_type:complete